MIRFVWHRLLTASATLLVSTFGICMLIHLIPCDPWR